MTPRARPVALFGVAAAVLLLAGVQCSQTPVSPGVGAPPAGAGTAAFASPGSCNLDLGGEKGATVFFVLGFLDEYLGRQFVEGGDLVERFYCDEHDKAALFRRVVVRLAEEQGLDPVITDEAVQQCLILYHSKTIADRLNSCYRYQLTSAVMACGDGTCRWTATASLGSYLFTRRRPSTGRDSGQPEEGFLRPRALAYLAGAWTRYGRSGDFVFANAHEKAALIVQLLTNLGCPNVRLESTTSGVPHGNRVHFEPTAEVSAWLDRSW